jgi:hypothetical protein
MKFLVAVSILGPIKFFFEGTGGACAPTGILLKKKHSVTTSTGSKLKKQRKKQKKWKKLHKLF